MKLRIASAIAALALAAAPAQAVIVSITLSGGSAFTNGGTGQIIAAPADVAKVTLNGNSIFGFNEVTNVPLVPNRPNGFRFATNDAGNINPGVPVSSHFFVFSPNANRGAIGTITFNQNVIAVQRTNVQLTSIGTNQLQTGATDFTALRDLEVGDLITRVNSKTISFDLNAVNAHGDMFRIITGVPEASTWAMMLAGFGMVGFGMRRRRVAFAA